MKYLDGLEQDRADEVALAGKKYSYILDKPYRRETWAAPKGKVGQLNKSLTRKKLTPLLRLKYHDSIADAVADLGRPEAIGMLFSGFQKYLYYQTATA